MAMVVDEDANEDDLLPELAGKEDAIELFDEDPVNVRVGKDTGA
jgi:hypothetical protein